MTFYADLHVHSKYSRATSRDCDLEHLAAWAQRKGLAVVATGDFTHPAWWQELNEKLIPAEPGLFRLRPEIERQVETSLPGVCRRPVRFLLEVEISTIYKKGDKTRKVHHLVYAPDFATAGRFRDALERIGNIASDGRPILGLDSRHLLETVLESGPDAFLVPAHIWTPWFSVLGSKSGFDAVEECYGDLSDHIFAVETGLSSDPPMNWRVSALDRYTLVSSSDAHSPPRLGREANVFACDLDYFAMRRALETGDGFEGTVEFFPEEGKYHLDGHRACGVRCEPDETRRHDGKCPTCGKPLTVGVMHRVEVLADRPDGIRPERTAPFRSFVSLPDMVGEIRGVGPRSKGVERSVALLVSRFGPELDILESLPREDLERYGDALLGEAVARLRRGQVQRHAGFDGEYGTISVFEPGEIDRRTRIAPLFEPVGRGDLDPGASPLPVAGTLFADPPDPVEAREPTEPAVGDGAELPTAPPPPAPATTALGVLSGLDHDQRSAAEIVRGPLLVVAGPGSGKTRTLTHRLAHLLCDAGTAPEECLAITFTRRAAAEMRERLERLVPEAAERLLVTTFHGLGLHLLRELHLEAGLEPGFRVVDAPRRLDLARELFRVSRRDALRLLEDIGRARRAAVTEGVTRAEHGDSGPRAAPATVDAYVAALRERSLVDFDDLLVEPVALLARQPDLRAALARRWRHLSIDEYQDVDAVQYRLVRLIAGALEDPELGGSLCAIGDPDQSIYRFRGAEVGFFLRFAKDFPGAHTVELGRNYRSNRTIVAAAGEAIAPATLAAGRRFEAAVDDATKRLVVHRAHDERREAGHVAATIDILLGGTSHYSIDRGISDGDAAEALSFDDFAVLYRTAAQAKVLGEALANAGIPFQQRGHTRLAKREDVQELLATMRREPSAGEGKSDAIGVADRLRAAATAIGAGEDEGDDGDVVELLLPLARRCGDDVDRFAAEIALGAEIDTWDPRADRVSLLTLHAAKGLEFSVVFLVGCEDGLLPLRWAAEPDELAEERRLFFVGLTRARRRLFLSWAAERRVAGERRERRPSPFLADISEALLRRRGDAARDRRERPETRQLRLL